MTKDDSPRRAVSPAKHVAGLLILASIGLLVIGLTNGRIVAEKVVTDMVMPVGLTWSALTLVCYFALLLRQRFLLLLGLLAWLLLTLGSNSLIAGRLMRSLEEQYVATRPLGQAQPYDLLVVLGGGTNMAANGQAQFGTSGDRVGLAARMYQADLAKQIVCTGSRIAALSAADQPHAGEQSRMLLESLGVPAEKIRTIPGRNTSEEIRHLAEFLVDHPHARVGLLTSAWHLPRAMRLAEAANLQVEPVPADFKTGQRKVSVRSFVPSDSALAQTRMAMREHLAGLVGR